MGQPKLLKLAECLSKPVVVRFAFEELASLKVLHEIDYIKEEDKIVYLLYLLEKTQPQAAIFCENKLDCDEVNKFLLSRGVRSVCLHGGKSHKERQEAIS
jgi:ATP-dependent RNA helicase DDX41